MARLLGGCVGRTIGLLLVVAGVGLAWFNRDQVLSVWDRLVGNEVEASPDLAARADEKLASLGEGGSTRVALSEAELQSLIEYRWSAFLPADVVDPRARIGDGRVTLEGSVATARFGRVAELQEIIAFLPDTTSLRAVASFVPLDHEHVALEIHELGAAGIPVPGRLIPTVLGKFQSAATPGLAANALALPLPPGIRTVYVSGDSLVFMARDPEGG